MSDPTDFPNLQAAMRTHQLVEDALALPPADFDRRTLDAVDRIIEREAVARPWANEVKMFRLLGQKIRRELGGTE